MKNFFRPRTFFEILKSIFSRTYLKIKSRKNIRILLELWLYVEDELTESECARELTDKVTFEYQTKHICTALYRIAALIVTEERQPCTDVRQSGC